MLSIRRGDTGTGPDEDLTGAVEAMLESDGR